MFSSNSKTVDAVAAELGKTHPWLPCVLESPPQPQSGPCEDPSTTPRGPPVMTEWEDGRWLWEGTMGGVSRPSGEQRGLQELGDLSPDRCSHRGLPPSPLNPPPQGSQRTLQGSLTTSKDRR